MNYLTLVEGGIRQYQEQVSEVKDALESLQATQQKQEAKQLEQGKAWLGQLELLEQQQKLAGYHLEVVSVAECLVRIIHLLAHDHNALGQLDGAYDLVIC